VIVLRSLWGVIFTDCCFSQNEALSTVILVELLEIMLPSMKFHISRFNILCMYSKNNALLDVADETAVDVMFL